MSGLNLNEYSKEGIKARMLRDAAQVWGLKSVHAIDPFVRLLIDAFSAEIFRVGNDIQTVSRRILEKLARMLTPSIYTAPQPAHAVGVVEPLESVEILPAHVEFFFKKAFNASVKSASDTEINIPFTPVDSVRLVNMRVSLLFAADTCYTTDGLYNKIPIAKMPAGTIPYRKIILGIDASNYSDERLPAVLSFYCPNAGFEYLDFVYKLLPFVVITSNGKSLKARPGLSYMEQPPAEGYEAIFREYAIRRRMEENIKDIYKDKFIEISGITGDMIQTELPESLQFAHHPEIVQAVAGRRMLWLEMAFPAQFTAEMLANFSFILNAFPVYNRGWKTSECSLDVMGNNVPLPLTETEHFLYVEEVVDSFGNKYSEIPFTQSDDLQKGLYTVRMGGMERFDERNALDMIDNVLDLTRDEVSAFGMMEKDKVKDALINMTAQMKQLDRGATHADRSVKQETNYVIVDPTDDAENFRAAYWVAHCDFANHIRPGMELTQVKQSRSGITRNLLLLTETVGGAREQRGTDAIQAYKYALTARDRIITKEDIKSFCRLTLKEQIKEIDVKRGAAVSDKPKEGFIRTLEVDIAPQSYALYGKNYWDAQAAALKRQIAARAVDGVEYIVRIIDKDDE